MGSGSRSICALFVLFILLSGSCQARAETATIRERIRERVRGRIEEKIAGASFSREGVNKFFIKHDGISRFYLLYVPASYDAKRPVPLLLAFHGGSGDSSIMANDEYYNLISKSDKEGFIVAFPNGASRLRSGKFATWNAGSCCAYSRDNNIDDVGFVGKVIDDITSRYSIDNKRIYATGISNGAMFSYRLACDMPGTFKAIAAVAGTENYDKCFPSSPVSILHIHAKNDSHCLFDGGAGPGTVKDVSRVTNYTSVPETISRWVERDRCDPSPKRALTKDGVYCDVYTGCSGGAKIELCVTEDGGHSWPGAKKKPRDRSDQPSQAISAVDRLWEFFDSLP